MHDDHRIIELLNQRNEQVLQIIQKQYGAFCYQVAYRIIGNREDADECVNDMLMGVWNSIPPNSPDHLPAYLAALVRKTALQKYEKAHRQKRGGTQFSTALDEISEIIPSTDRVDQEIEQRELTNVITAWLQSLPPDTKLMFIERYYMSDSVKTIAEKHKLSAGAVKMKLLRIRQQLREYLEKEGFV